MAITLTDTSGYPLEVLRDRPRLYFRLQESSGNFVATDGTIATSNGTVTYAQPNIVAGKSVSAKFADAGYALANPLLYAMQAGYDYKPLVIEAWIRDPGPAGPKDIFYWAGSTVYIDAEGIGFKLPTTSGTVEAYSRVESWNRTYYVVAMLVGKQVLLYVNAQLVAETSFDGDFIYSGSNFIFGRTNMQEFAVYTQALSSDRIAAHFLAGMAGGGYREYIELSRPDSFWIPTDEQARPAFVFEDDTVVEVGERTAPTYTDGITIDANGATVATDQYIMPPPLHGAAGSISIEFEVSAAQTNTIRRHILSINNESTFDRIEFVRRTTGTYALEIVDTTASAYVGTEPPTAYTNEIVLGGLGSGWHRITVTWGEEYVRLYYNGSLVSSYNNKLLFNESPIVTLGANYQQVDVFGGALRNYRYYDRELTSAEVSANAVLDADYILTMLGTWEPGAVNTYTTDTVDLSELGTPALSKVRWRGVGTVLVEASLDNGVNWATCTNNGAIPGVNSVNMDGKSLTLRATVVTLRQDKPAYVRELRACVYATATIEDVDFGDYLSFSTGAFPGDDKSLVEADEFAGMRISSGSLQIPVVGADSIEFLIKVDGTPSTRTILEATGNRLYYNAGTWAVTGGAVYVDGVFNPAGTDPLGTGWRHVVWRFASAFTGTVYLFSRPAGTEKATGQISDIAVYSRVLMAPEIVRHAEQARYGKQFVNLKDTDNSVSIGELEYRVLSNPWSA